MKKITSLIVISFLISLQLYVSVAGAQMANADKPNIIFIMVDDLGKLPLPAYRANTTVKMPNLNRLADEGVIFENAYATPVCHPSRAKLVSGRHSLNTGAYINWSQGGDVTKSNRTLDGGRTTGFYQYFYDGNSSAFSFIDPRYIPSFAFAPKQAGYATAVAGKWHLNDYSKQPRTFATFGFDRWMMPGSHLLQGIHTDKGFVVTPGFVPGKTADLVINFIVENKNTPFFLYYPMHLIHHPPIATPLKPQAETSDEKLIAMIEYVDLIIGRILQTLEALKLRDRTIIFFSSDNGANHSFTIQSPEQKKQIDAYLRHKGKGTLYEGGINVPFIVSGGPVVKRGKTEALVDFTDVFPTIAEFSSVPVVQKERENDDDYRGIADRYTLVNGKYKVDGYSIVPFLTGQAEDTPRDWMMYSYGTETVLRDKRFKLWTQLRKHKHRGYKLYDLYEDPYEQTNLYGSDEPIIVSAKQRLEQIASSLPEPTQIDLYFDPMNWHYGMLAHWTMDRPKAIADITELVDNEGGYNIQSDTEIILTPGKFKEAIAANHLYAPYSNDLFYNYLPDSSNRLFARLYRLSLFKEFPGSRTFYIALSKLIRSFNKTFMEYTNTIYNWFTLDEHLSQRGKFFSSMTVSAWVRSPQPKQDTYLLKQPYTNKEASLMDFSITREGGLRFELTTNGKAHKLQSKALDNQLWEQWVHIAATWDGRDECGQTILYVNGEQIAEDCLGKPLSAEGSDNLLLGGFSQDFGTDNREVLVDDIALWRQPLMPVQIRALYHLGERFSYNAADVEALFNTPKEDGVTRIGEHLWRQITVEDASDSTRVIIREFPNAVEVQFGDVMAIRKHR